MSQLWPECATTGLRVVGDMGGNAGTIQHGKSLLAGVRSSEITKAEETKEAFATRFFSRPSSPLDEVFCHPGTTLVPPPPGCSTHTRAQHPERDCSPVCAPARQPPGRRSGKGGGTVGKWRGNTHTQRGEGLLAGVNASETASRTEEWTGRGDRGAMEGDRKRHTHTRATRRGTAGRCARQQNSLARPLPRCLGFIPHVSSHSSLFRTASRALLNMSATDTSPDK
jgi:hypothetical protein